MTDGAARPSIHSFRSVVDTSEEQCSCSVHCPCKSLASVSSTTSHLAQTEVVQMICSCFDPLIPGLFLEVNAES